MTTRRDFLSKGLLAGAGALMIPELAKAVARETIPASAPKITLKKDAVIMMQGDSITDAGRDRAANQCNTFQMLGNGYPLFIAGQLLAKHPTEELKIYNRGVSGDKVPQLRARWEVDCINFKPDVISILVGVNDYWHTLTGGYKGTLAEYESDYRDLLRYTKEKLPDVQLIIGEPYILKGGSAIDESRWLPMFDGYRAAARKLATEFNAVFVPYQTAYDAAMKQVRARYWANDGVHADLPGRQLMANLWLEATGL
jgi:lysophospholipase L1-like esterase